MNDTGMKPYLYKCAITWRMVSYLSRKVIPRPYYRYLSIKAVVYLYLGFTLVNLIFNKIVKALLGIGF